METDSDSTNVVGSSAAKRPRKANWTASEMEILVSEVGLRSSVLFSSFSSTLNLKTKRKSWEEVTEKVNANSSTKRDWSDIKKKWTDMKSNTRKRAAHSKRESNKTGGGPAPVCDLNSLEQMVASLIPSCQLEGCEGGLESEEISILSEEKAATPLQVTTVAEIHHIPEAANSSMMSEPTPEPIRVPVPNSMNVTVDTGNVTPLPQPSRTKAASFCVSPKRKIISIEEKKLEVMTSLLETQKELLSVERRRLAVEEEKLVLLKSFGSVTVVSPQVTPQVSPVIKFY